ncbi:spore coat protein [Mesobacillus campisalis]|uniref:Spore coat protein n=1 Tax=Mesobacillus campisalis TaxID=1408103 RepID=A0A0M2SV91_9BACI|nr:spore coat protein [Mesobacillus campisalis]KKK38484.1 spore coat protein [Mesobacillus campisalis]
MSLREPNTLAWHETLEIHELVAFQSVGLMKLKMSYRKIADVELRGIYESTIQGLTQNINELVQFYPSAPVSLPRNEQMNNDIAFYAADLLAFLKTSVRNYAVAITETATPAVRTVMASHLSRAVKAHERIFRYMYKNGLYPSYNLGQLLQNDLQLAQKALSMDY